MSSESLRERWNQAKEAAKEAAKETAREPEFGTDPFRRRPPSAGPQRGHPTAPLSRVVSWEDAERLAASHMQSLGFHDARVTPRGNDGGVDVWAAGAVAQVKLHGSKTGRPAVQALHGVATAEQASALFYATEYSPKALAYANATGIALFTFTRNGDVAPASKSAHTLVQRSPSVGQKAGFLTRARADRYRLEAERISSTMNALTAKMQKRTQSRSAARRDAAGRAAQALIVAARSMDSMEMLPAHDRRREDFMKGAKDAIKMAKRLL